LPDRNAANAAARAIAEPDDDDRDPQEYAGGVFDEDEPAEVVQAAAAKKVAVKTHNKSSGSQVRQRILASMMASHVVIHILSDDNCQDH
jgi:hypothetical protein